MPEHHTIGFSWSFLDEIGAWTLGLAGVVSIGSVLVVGDLTFAAGCMIAATLDVVLVHLAAHSAIRALQSGTPDAFSGAVLLGGRLLVKGALLVIALVIPGVLDFAGAVVGALAYDVTLASVGSILAIRRGFSRAQEGR